MREIILATVACALLVGTAESAQAQVIRAVRAAIADSDLTRAEQLARMAVERDATDPESLEALSWVARGALAAGDLDLARTVALDTRSLAERALAGRSPNVDRNLEIALGAALEVQAQAMARRGERSDAVYLLQRAVERYAGTAVHARLQKNVLLLSLEGTAAIELDTTEFLTEPRATLESLRGQPLVLFFWAHWCPDCKAQAPSIGRLIDEFGDQGLRVVAPTQRYGYVVAGTAAGAREEREHIAAVQQEYYPFLASVPVPMSEENFRNYGVSSTPTLALVDRQGVVQLYNPGNLAEDELREAVRALVAAQ